MPSFPQAAAEADDEDGHGGTMLDPPHQEGEQPGEQSRFSRSDVGRAAGHIENDLPLYSQTVYNRHMDIIYQFQGVEFGWDEEKARSNIANHGVTFEEAAEVFFDPFYQGGDASTEDKAHEFIIGYSLAQRLLLVVYVDRGERTRIILARQATRPERKLYEEA